MRHSVKRLHKSWAKSYTIQGQGQLSNDRNLDMFQKVLDGNATTRRAELNEDSLGNFEKTIDNAQTMAQMLSS